MFSSVQLASLMRGTSGLELGYASVQIPMAIAMLRARAGLRKLLLSPVAAVPLTVATGIICSLFGPSTPLPALLFGTAVGAALGFGAGSALGVSRAQGGSYRRGARVIDERVSQESARARDANLRQSMLAGCQIPASDEAKHFKIIGTTGTGKSTAIGELLGPALRRGDRAVIADPDGGYLRRYYDASRSDVILNPFDARSAPWDPFGEIRQPYDAEHLVRSLLPDPESGDRTWCGYARTLLTSVIRQAHAAGIRHAGELYRLITIAPVAELRQLTAGTPAQPFFEEHNVRMFDSIRSVASSAIASLEHVAGQSGTGFSVREWVGSHSSGVLFMPYRADQIAALRSTVSAWMRLALFETMASPEGDRRIWFVVDELDAIGKIDGLKDALARVRKFGGRCILGFQSIAQVSSTYGAGEAHTLVENCANSLILRCSASEGGGTARFASALIGQREVLRTMRSRTMRATEFLGSETRSEQLSIEPAVMDSEIEQLPDLAGYLKLASEDRWRRVELSPPVRDTSQRNATPSYVPMPPIVVSRCPPKPVTVEPRTVKASRKSSVRSRSSNGATPATRSPRRRMACKDMGPEP